MRLFSYRNRPVHPRLSPLERLTQQRAIPDRKQVAPAQALSFDDADPESLSHTMGHYAAMLYLVRDGAINPSSGDVPAGQAGAQIVLAL